MTAPARSLPLPPSIGADLRMAPEAPALRANHGVGAWLLLAVVVVGAFFVLIWSRTALDRSAFVLDELDARVEMEEDRYWNLRLQVTELQAPDRILSLAEDMGMVYPARVETIDVPALGTPVRDVEDRWAELKALLGAQP